MTQNFKKNSKQIEAIKLLISVAKHILLYGGSRSGKTFILVFAIIVRALKCKSRHVILRLHFNAVKQSIWLDTLPKVMDLCFPGLREKCVFNKSDWFVTFPNRSELWIGGLDDKERTEKILGKEYSTLYFNECSEISLESRDLALTRLAEKNDLVKKCFYDENPPKMAHWTFKYFIENKDKDDQPVEGYASMKLNPKDNQENIDPNYIKDVLEKLPPLLKMRFLEGEFGSDETDIFKPEWLKTCPTPKAEDIADVYIFCDPAVKGKELAKDDTCESAIVVIGATWEGNLIDLDVIHGFFEYQELKLKCKATYERFKTFPSCRFGVEDVAAQQWLVSDMNAMGISCIGVPADQDKTRRAISITDLLAEGRCYINDLALRKQLLSFPSGKLKDLCDAYTYNLRMYKKYGQRYYKDPRKQSEFTGLTNEEYQRQRVEKFQRALRKRAQDKADGKYSDPTLGKRW